MLRIITLCLIVFAFSFIAQAQLQLAQGLSTIDGIIDSNDTWGSTWIAQDSIIGGSTMTSHFQIANDANNIYLVVEVTDSTPNNDPAAIPNSYERDCIEVCFSMKSSDLETVDYVSGDWQIRCQREAELADDNPYLDGSNQVADNLDNIEFEVVTGPQGYVVEMAFPIDMLAEDSDFDGENFRFDLATADNNGTGRVKQAFWAGASDNQWKDTGVFGDAVLAPQTGDYSINFTVVNENAKALDGAIVKLIGVKDASTDENGKATFENRANGTYQYTVMLDGYENLSGSVKLSGASTDVSVTLLSLSTVTFQLTNIYEKAIADAVVTFDSVEYVSNAGGIISVANLKRGNYNYSVVAEGYPDTLNTVELIGEDVILDIVMIPLATVTFQVSDEHGVVSNALITFDSVENVTNDAGVVSITDVKAGNHTYTVVADGYNEITDSIKIEGADVVIGVTLTATVGIEINSQALINVFPNPASNKVQIKFIEKADAVAIYDQVGKVVYSNTNIQNAELLEINIADFANGVYIIQTKSGKKLSNDKLIVE